MKPEVNDLFPFVVCRRKTSPLVAEQRNYLLGNPILSKIISFSFLIETLK